MSYPSLDFDPILKVLECRWGGKRVGKVCSNPSLSKDVSREREGGRGREGGREL
jgi:hypothetical protein